MLSALRNALLPLTPRLRWLWLAVVPLHVAGAVAELAAAAALAALAATITGSTVTGRLGRFLSLVTPPSDEVTRLAAFALAVFILKNAVAALAIHANGRLVAASMSAAFRRLIQCDLADPIAEHLATAPASRIFRATHGISDTYRYVLSGLTGIVGETLVALALLGALVATAPASSLILPLLLLTVTTAILIATRRVTVAWGRESHLASSRVFESLERTFGAIRSIRANRAEPAFADDAARVYAESMPPFRRLLVVLPMPRLFIETALVVITLAFIAAVHRAAGPGAVLPAMALFGYAALRLVPCAIRLIALADQVRQGSFPARELAAAIRVRRPEARPEVPIEREIVCRGVTCLHRGSGAGVVGVDLTIRRGECVGITGPSGSGKTTLLDLLAGIAEPQEGEIAVDGRTAVLPRVGYAAQNADVFDESLLVNITLAPGRAFDEHRLRRAIRNAGLDAFVASLPSGLEARVGAAGARVSGGERQRIALARSFYREPDLLVLDEPVASLDASTAADILATIASLKGRTTVVLASHEESSLALCDRVIELREGRLADDRVRITPVAEDSCVASTIAG